MTGGKAPPPPPPPPPPQRVSEFPSKRSTEHKQEAETYIQSPGAFPFYAPWLQQPTYVDSQAYTRINQAASSTHIPYPYTSSPPGVYAPHSPAMYPTTAPNGNPNLLRPTHVLTGGGFVSPVLGPADWQAQFAHAVNLQKATAGFLSPAVGPPGAFSPLLAATPPGGGRGDASNTTESEWPRATHHDTQWPPDDSGQSPPPDRNVMALAEEVLQWLLSEKKCSDTITAQVLQVAVALLHQTSGSKANSVAAFVKLAHPDDFKNPSTFLKIYGDPLCFSKAGPLPKKDRNGNWVCGECGNVNFPRRFRCNVCTRQRDSAGDWVVGEYARQVYDRYLYLYRNHTGGDNCDITVPVPEVQQPSSNHKVGSRRSRPSVKRGGGGYDYQGTENDDGGQDKKTGRHSEMDTRHPNKASDINQDDHHLDKLLLHKVSTGSAGAGGGPQHKSTAARSTVTQSMASNSSSRLDAITKTFQSAVY